MFYGNFQSNAQKAEFKAALSLLERVFGRIYAADNLIGLQRSAGFREDPKFMAAVKKHAVTAQERSILWRLHTLCWAAKNVLPLEGDFVECGVWKGFSMGVVCDFIEFAKQDRRMYLYDTFEGIPDAYNSENRCNAIYQQENETNANNIHEQCCARFSEYTNVHVVQGIVPRTFSKHCPDKIAFLHLDMNAAASEIAALDHLFDRVVPGGMIILDDYGWTGYGAQKVAEDAWFARCGNSVLELASGQGLVVKQSA